ncbi:uncharacterized protein BX663DRAFT_525074 [Cokeromyces recurvatus]|uniref:uncharacterized protein n=1 Tax=Cokeromyces recurvatus TaxID=90255 RepID=UPI0022210C34|nr:uncharacterized protein BX663DRAFT_525074 [Cokeromyces recurvatus]KAI7898365.1 hypothetical protein BX663DRAFT_525074 [Cokeromyces recurvatus]
MSNKNEVRKRSSDEIDAQKLFEQFAPSLYFENPKVSLKNEWFIIAEQTVPCTRDSFWQTINHWIVEPQFAIPPIEKANIISRTQSEDNHDNCFSQEPTESIIRELIPKRKSKDKILTENVTYFENDKECRVIFQPKELQENNLPFYYPKVKAYSFVYDSESNVDSEERDKEEQGTLRLEIIPFNTNQVAVLDTKMQYALKTILHKLFKWCIQKRLGYKKKGHHDVLVPKEAYQTMYQTMKTKYGPQLVANWTEKTDPKKFVYEDIAIASYLLCLWKEEEIKNKRKPTFVDLGCGNGLLTFLLVSEGYEGYGIDIASRKIWSALCKNQKKNMLRVETLYPAETVYPEAEWLIGNHADELVPWIPIIASKSGEDCKFIVIPCCFYGLDGTRSISLPNTKDVGKYKAYTDYITDIATKVGYKCEQDCLRIPSTKNIAIVGRTKQKVNDINIELVKSIEVASRLFIPRKTDREKEEIRQENKKPKLEK